MVSKKLFPEPGTVEALQEHFKHHAAKPVMGMPDGIRNYFQPGDSPWRLQHDYIRRVIAGYPEPVGMQPWKPVFPTTQACCWCEHCGFVGSTDDFDVLGADPGNLFCLECGEECDGDDFPLEMEAT